MATFRNLRKYRTEAGLSQAELHRKSNVSRDIISGFERGGDHAANLAYALLNTLNDYFFTAKGRPISGDEVVETSEVSSQ